MKRMMGGAALTAAVMALAPLQANAQAGMRGQRAMRNEQARPGVEMIMRLRERLELTEAQLSRLDAIRETVVRHRTARAAEMEELRSQRMATPLDREAMREQAEAFRAEAATRREAAQAFSEDIRSQVESILTDDQKAELENLAGRARAYQRGRASAQRGQRGAIRQGRGAARGGRGMRPGMRGQGQGRGAGQGWGPQRMGPPAPRGAIRRGGPVGFGPGFGPPWEEMEIDSLPLPSGS